MDSSKHRQLDAGTRYAPDMPSGRAMRRIVQWMIDQLDSGAHEVTLIPAPDPQHSGHMIRIAANQHCPWYRDFNRQFTSIRGRGRKRYQRPRTIIRSDCTRATLVRMLAGNFRGVQAERLVEYIERKRRNHRFRRQRQQAEKSINWTALGIRF